MNDYEKMIKQNNGIIYANKLEEYNIDRHILRKLVDNGYLKRIGIKIDFGHESVEML